MTATNEKDYPVVGDAPHLLREQHRQYLRERFSEHTTLCHIRHFQLVFGQPIPRGAYEFEKTPKELAIFEFANAETNRVMESVGAEPLDVSIDHQHVVLSATFRIQLQANGYNHKRPPLHAFCDANLIHALYPKSLTRNVIHFGAAVLHETLHLKSQVIIETAIQNEEPMMTSHRMGIRKTEENATSFEGLSEAIVEEQTKRSFPRLLELPALAPEKDWYYSAEGKAARQKIAIEQQIPEDEIYWVDKNHPNRYESFSYPTQRAILNFICDQIYLDKKQTFQNPEQVFQQLFLLAEFTGMPFDAEVTTQIAFGDKGFSFIKKMDRDDRRAKLSTLEKRRTEQQNRRIRMFVCGPSGCSIDSIPATLPED